MAAAAAPAMTVGIPSSVGIVPPNISHDNSSRGMPFSPRPFHLPSIILPILPSPSSSPTSQYPQLSMAMPRPIIVPSVSSPFVQSSIHAPFVMTPPSSPSIRRNSMSTMNFPRVVPTVNVSLQHNRQHRPLQLSSGPPSVVATVSQQPRLVQMSKTPITPTIAKLACSIPSSPRSPSSSIVCSPGISIATQALVNGSPLPHTHQQIVQPQHQHQQPIQHQSVHALQRPRFDWAGAAYCGTTKHSNDMSNNTKVSISTVTTKNVLDASTTTMAEAVAARYGLMFKGVLEKTGNYSRIRVWKNEKGLTFYDCTCGKRRPDQGLKKIKHHAYRHSVIEHICNYCGKVYPHHCSLNAHKRVHKRRDSFSADVKIARTSTSAI